MKRGPYVGARTQLQVYVNKQAKYSDVTTD